ncbi:MAG: tetratricopeptide repeat protein [Candidatus Methanofastidiosia archaeon]|jgi:tetratricopeptide (TPR) repeat protein/ribonuclease BN (tRNA processing enzyme)
MVENNNQKLMNLIKEGDRKFSYSSDKEDTKSLYKKALKEAKKRKKQLETEYVQGKIDLIDKKWKNALERFNKVIELDAAFFKAWCYKGVALYGLRKYKEALECFEEALEFNSNHAESWYNKSFVLHDLGKYQEALKCSDKALEIENEFVNALNIKGILLRRLDRYGEALNCYRKALKINSKNADVWNNKGVLLNRMCKYPEALECFNKALNISPQHAFAQNNKNVTLRYLKRFDQADKEDKKLSLEKKKQIDNLKISKNKKRKLKMGIDVADKIKSKLKEKSKKILGAKEKYEEKLAKSLGPREKPLSGNFFLVLRRWNSYTPFMLTATDLNLGGGYFLHWKGKGIVIDPGIHFVNNFFQEGLLIHDIDAVIITHAHVDHCFDFESLLTLIHEYNEKRNNSKEKKKIDVFMNLGTLKKFLSWIPIEKDKENILINRVYPLERSISYDLPNYNLRLNTTKAIHDEVFSKSYSVGFILELYGEGKYTEDNPFRIGYTSDTAHDEHVETQYEGMDVIISHLGSVNRKDFHMEEKESHSRYTQPEFDIMNELDKDESKLDENENVHHLMLRGVIHTIYKSQAKLAIVSEFGEELGEQRMTIVNALDSVFQDQEMARCLAGDIGLKVLLPDLKVECHYCRGYANINEILEEIDPKNIMKKCVIHFCSKCENIYEHEKREMEQNCSALLQ